MIENTIILLYKRRYIIEYSIKLHRDMLVNMTLSEKPLVVIAGFCNFFK
jgi:hypothetical protein